MQWLIKHKRIAIEAILTLAVALSLCYASVVKAQKDRALQSLEMAQNNVVAYQGIINEQAESNRVLKLDITKLQHENDAVIHKLDSVMKKQKINAKNVSLAATQNQTIDVTGAVVGLSLEETIKKDTIYTDSLLYNELTKVIYCISRDSISIRLKVNNTQYLYVYKKRQYKNKKNFFKRLFTFDWKKETVYKYDIINTNPLLTIKDVRIIEQIDK